MSMQFYRMKHNDLFADLRQNYIVYQQITLDIALVAQI